MWCTRWFLPLVILPLPTAPPYFLAVFLISMFLHARPCFYCMMLLTALFTSSCYWQALPLDAPLTRPLGNATTFGEAIRANLSVPDTNPNAVELPPVMQLLDRCWCNVFSRNGLFEPTNVSTWELASVEQARREIEARAVAAKEERENDNDNRDKAGPVFGEEESDSDSDENAPSGGSAFSLRGLRALLFPTMASSSSSSSNNKFRLKPACAAVPSDTPPSRQTASLATKSPVSPSIPSSGRDPRSSDPHLSAANMDALPKVTEPPKLLRPYYDLRPYGLDITLDFRWDRQ